MTTEPYAPAPYAPAHERAPIDAPPDPTSDANRAETGNTEVQRRVDDALAKGYVGEVPDPTPNDAYSIRTGPDAPALSPDDRTRFAQPAAANARPESEEISR